MQASSSGSLSARARSTGSCASDSWKPSATSAAAAAWLTRSIASRRLPPPCRRARSPISAAQRLARSSTPRAGGDVRHGGRRPDLVDRLEPGGEMVAARKLEQHDRPLGRDEQVARRIAGVEHLHVAGAGGVADVDRIEQHAARQLARLQLLPQPPEPAQPQPFEVGVGRFRSMVRPRWRHHRSALFSR